MTRAQVVKRRSHGVVAAPQWLARSLSGLGLLVALACPAGAAGRKLVSPHQPNRPAPDQPWTEAGGSLPPLPPARSEAPGAPWKGPESGQKPALADPSAESPNRAERKRGSKVHPAIHPTPGRNVHGGTITPLFSKAGTEPNDRDLADAEERGLERQACMARHPAGRDLEDGRAHTAEKYTVQAGDTLWDIAERVLDRDDVRAIARYWPKIHRANRQVLGADPNRLTPGQVLLLPSTRTMPN